MLTEGDCRFDDSGTYRYWLRRGDPKTPPSRSVAFVMLNPSTASADDEDPTVRRCRGFAERWGFDRMDVVNLFAYRAVHPKELTLVDDPIGDDNERWLASVRAHRLVVCAWGIHGTLMERGDEVAGELRRHCRTLKCFGLTKNGHPRHPLYLRADAKLVSF